MVQCGFQSVSQPMWTLNIYIVNLIINRLCSEPITSTNFVQLEKCNHTTNGNLFNEYL